MKIAFQRMRKSLKPNTKKCHDLALLRMRHALGQKLIPWTRACSARARQNLLALERGETLQNRKIAKSQMTFVKQNRIQFTKCLNQLSEAMDLTSLRFAFHSDRIHWVKPSCEDPARGFFQVNVFHSLKKKKCTKLCHGGHPVQLIF